MSRRGAAVQGGASRAVAANQTPSSADLVVRWQRAHGRHDLPWQHSRDPYRVWLSEIMLQQTQVATVLGYYARFVARFPDVESLARADQDEVLALWSGLGYYSRARHLHRCAQVVVERFGGRFPAHSAALAELPGIGRSTAAAIAAFCFGERCAILDGNVKRVLARMLGVSDDLAQARHERALWHSAQALLPAAASDIAAYTQGLMDLGATVCTLRCPRCEACPLAARCRARAEGRPEAYPVKSRRLARGQRRLTLLWLCHGERLWLTQRPQQGVWAGLWSLPEWADDAALASLTADWPGSAEALTGFKHVLTHLDLWLAPLRWTLPATLHADALAALTATLPAGRWLARDAALALGLPAPIRRLLLG